MLEGPAEMAAGRIAGAHDSFRPGALHSQRASKGPMAHAVQPFAPSGTPEDRQTRTAGCPGEAPRATVAAIPRDPDRK